MLLTRPSSAKNRSRTYAIAATVVTVVLLYIQIQAKSASRLDASSLSSIQRSSAARRHGSPGEGGLVKQQDKAAPYGPGPHGSSSLPDKATTTVTVTSMASASPEPDLARIFPEDYGPAPKDGYCEARFGTDFLQSYASNYTQYCADGASSLKCFYHERGELAWSPHDYFCVAEGAMAQNGRFYLSCDVAREKRAEIDRFPEYMYWTSVKKVFQNHFILGSQEVLDRHINNLHCGSVDKRRSDKSTAVLFMRDTGANMWHSLMEIMNYYLTMDVLALARDDKGEPFFSPDVDSKDLQVFLADDVAPGPYVDLWSLYSSKPTISIKDLDPATTCFDRVIIPAPGHSNPMWEGDWNTHSCHNSTLLQAFRSRVMRHMDVATPAPSKKPIITFLNRRKTRRLLQFDRLVKLVKKKYPEVSVQTLDLSSLSFADSLPYFAQSDVLVGTHGAGLTGQLFMRERSTVVEFIPPDMWHKGFRNMAQLLGHKYLSMHGPRADPNKQADWKEPPVTIEDDRFMRIMDIAIKTVVNQDNRNQDVD